jgi:hypothetical protein
MKTLIGQASFYGYEDQIEVSTTTTPMCKQLLCPQSEQ